MSMRLKDALGGGSSGDIVLNNTVTNELDNLSKRIEEEKSPVITDKADPLTCLKYGISLQVAKIMTPNDFTKEAASALVKANISIDEMMRLYGFKVKAAFIHLLKSYGLFPLPASKEENKKHPLHTYPTNQQKPKNLTPVETIKQGLPIEQAKQMAPEDMTKEDVIFLLEEGKLNKQQIRKIYGFKYDASFYKKLRKWGLVKKDDDITKTAPQIQKEKKEDLSVFEALEKLNRVEANIKCLSEIGEIKFIEFTDDVVQILNDSKQRFKEEAGKLRSALEATKVIIA